MSRPAPGSDVTPVRAGEEIDAAAVEATRRDVEFHELVVVRVAADVVGDDRVAVFDGDVVGAMGPREAAVIGQGLTADEMYELRALVDEACEGCRRHRADGGPPEPAGG